MLGGDKIIELGRNVEEKRREERRGGRLAVTKYVFRIVCSVRVCTENIYSKCVACFLALRFCLSVFVFVFVFVLFPLHSFSSIHFSVRFVPEKGPRIRAKRRV